MNDGMRVLSNLRGFWAGCGWGCGGKESEGDWWDGGEDGWWRRSGEWIEPARVDVGEYHGL